jgi:hypothetical protein
MQKLQGGPEITVPKIWFEVNKDVDVKSANVV